MASVHLTERALRDLDEIDSYSISTWGERIATRYLDDINAALQRLGESPALLQERSERSLRVRFYPVREHVLVCDVFGDDVYILAVWHGAMDLAGRLEELEPRLVEEAALLARKFRDV